MQRRAALLFVIAAVMAIHAVCLSDAATRARPLEAAPRVPSRAALLVRLDVPVSARAPVEVATAAAEALVPRTLSDAAGRGRIKPALPNARQPRGAADKPRGETSVVVVNAIDPAVTVLPTAAAASEPEAANEPEPTTYRTRVPAPFVFRYAMQRGQFTGTGELVWKREGDRYEAQLKGAVGGIPVLSWASTGTIDSSGLAPERYVDHRLGKSDQAASFQRADSRITFSGSSSEYPLAAGAQDRLSWMIQLPAILVADPSKARGGTRLGVFVVGARGDAEIWVFQSAGTEPVTTPSGTVKANKWMREPRRPYDTKVEVWLDPGRQYLPVRARLTSPPSDAPLDLQLVDAGG